MARTAPAQQREVVSSSYTPTYHNTSQQPRHDGTSPFTSRGVPTRVSPAPPSAPKTEDEDAVPAAEDTYRPDWLVSEAPNTITDAAFYDEDADGRGAAAGVHAHGDYSRSRSHSTSTSDTSSSSEIGEHDGSGEFEHPRQVPYDHRQTRMVLEEDVDFFMALLGGREPAAASSGTRMVVAGEEEVRRRGRETEVRLSAARRREELQDTQGDVDFFMSLMHKS